MKKIIALLVMSFFVLGIAAISADAATAAKAPAKKIVKKVAKKAVKKSAVKKIAPRVIVPPPPVAVPPPPPPPVVKKVAPAPAASLFGWGIDAAGSLGLVMNKSLWVGRADVLLSDPLGLGPIVGLSADSVKYKVGLGGFTGKDTNDNDFKGLSLNADGVIMIPADVLGGISSYLGGGLNYPIYRTGKTSGTLGGQIYYGIMGDIGLGGKSFMQVGYTIIRTGDTSFSRSSKGISVELGHSLTL